MKSSWKETLKSVAFEAQLTAASENASQNFQHNVQEAIEEIGKELKIINQLPGNDFKFTEQDSSFFNKDFVRISGMVLVAAGAILTFVFPPLGLLGVAGGIVSWLSGQFKSQDQKRTKPLKISQSFSVSSLKSSRSK